MPLSCPPLHGGCHVICSFMMCNPPPFPPRNRHLFAYLYPARRFSLLLLNTCISHTQTPSSPRITHPHPHASTRSPTRIHAAFCGPTHPTLPPRLQPTVSLLQPPLLSSPLSYFQKLPHLFCAFCALRLLMAQSLVRSRFKAASPFPPFLKAAATHPPPPLTLWPLYVTLLIL
jgi:hypothetical protein